MKSPSLIHNYTHTYSQCGEKHFQNRSQIPLLSFVSPDVQREEADATASGHPV